MILALHSGVIRGFYLILRVRKGKPLWDLKIKLGPKSEWGSHFYFDMDHSGPKCSIRFCSLKY